VDESTTYHQKNVGWYNNLEHLEKIEECRVHDTNHEGFNHNSLNWSLHLLSMYIIKMSVTFLILLLILIIIIIGLGFYFFRGKIEETSSTITVDETSTTSPGPTTTPTTTPIVGATCTNAWGEWSEWKPCNGSNRSRQRKRSIVNCPDDAPKVEEEIQSCNHCEGSWSDLSDWSDWSDWDNVCPMMTRTKSRIKTYTRKDATNGGNTSSCRWPNGEVFTEQLFDKRICNASQEWTGPK